MSKGRKQKDPREDGRAPLLTRVGKATLEASAQERAEADKGVGSAILGLRRYDGERRANML